MLFSRSELSHLTFLLLCLILACLTLFETSWREQEGVTAKDSQRFANIAVSFVR